jgi:hypothetical protein
MDGPAAASAAAAAAVLLTDAPAAADSSRHATDTAAIHVAIACRQPINQLSGQCSLRIWSPCHDAGCTDGLAGALNMVQPPMVMHITGTMQGRCAVADKCPIADTVCEITSCQDGV